MPNDLMGELVYAALRLNPEVPDSTSVTAPELIRFCREHLSSYKVRLKN